MTTKVVGCQKKQVVRKFVRSASHARSEPKKKEAASCSGIEDRRDTKRTETATCPEMERKKTGKSARDTGYQRNGKPQNHVQKVPCPEKEPKRTVKGCPKCENNRLEKLEIEVYQLRREMENMKNERKDAEKAVERAILRGARALGGRFKPIVPESIEKLLDTCESDATIASTSSSLLHCGGKSEELPCGHKATKKEEQNICDACCAH